MLASSRASFPAWIRLHSESLENIPEAKDLFASISLNTVVQQTNATDHWRATNWNGICEQLSKISNPSLILTGTDDFTMAPANSLIIAEKIPGAWLV